MEIMEFIKSVINQQQAFILLSFVVANLLTGTVSALMTHTFKLEDFKNFWTIAAKMFLAYGAVAIIAVGMADFSEIREVAWVALLAYMIKRIMKNLEELGLPVDSVPILGKLLTSK